MTVLLILSVIFNGVLTYTTINLLRKNEFYEEKIQEFYSSLYITLKNMQLIDERQMFESDDDVGVIFELLKDTLNGLRPLLNETPDE